MGWSVLAALGVAAAVSLAGCNASPRAAPERTFAAATASPPLRPSPPAPLPAPSTYVVRAGDSLYGIASANGVTLAALIQANGFPNSWVPINPGQVLRLPEPGSVAAIAEPPRVVAAATAASPMPAYQPQAAPPVVQTWAATCPNGSCYGQPSTVTGAPRTHYVRPYVTKGGRSVGGYYRSK